MSDAREQAAVCCVDGDKKVLDDCRSSSSMVASRLSIRSILFSLLRVSIDMSAAEEPDSLLSRDLNSVFVFLWALRCGPTCCVILVVSKQPLSDCVITSHSNLQLDSESTARYGRNESFSRDSRHTCGWATVSSGELVVQQDPNLPLVARPHLTQDEEKVP